MTDKQDPIAHAARLLREAAEELRQAHAYNNSEGWENETDAKAAYDDHLAAAQALEDWEQAVGAGGVQALSAAPAGFVPIAAFDRLHAHAESLAARLLAASPTPPAEQQATKETSGGFHVWRDISTAPKDGSRFVAIGYNYGLYSEGRHICVAQWFRGCWMETSDWNEASELQHLTHWLPLPSPPDNAAELNDLDVSVSPQQAAPKTAPGEQNTVPAEWLEQAYREGWAACRDAETIGEEAEDWAFGNSTANSRMIDAQQAAPQQEAQEPVAWYEYNADLDAWFLAYSRNPQTKTRPLVFGDTAPQPAPAPLSEMPYEKRKAIQEGEQIGASDAWFKARFNMLDTLDRRNVFRAGFDRGWNAAIAAQGGK